LSFYPKNERVFLKIYSTVHIIGANTKIEKWRGSHFVRYRVSREICAYATPVTWDIRDARCTHFIFSQVNVLSVVFFHSFTLFIHLVVVILSSGTQENDPHHPAFTLSKSLKKIQHPTKFHFFIIHSETHGVDLSTRKIQTMNVEIRRWFAEIAEQKKFVLCVPLPCVLCVVWRVRSESKRIKKEYKKMIDKL
jgi:membrane protein required for beta-lactamase induction